MGHTLPHLEETGDKTATTNLERQLVELNIAHQKHIESLKHAMEEKKQGLSIDSPIKPNPQLL